LTTAVGGASRLSLSREGKKCFVIRLTLGLHPGLQIFHPSGIWKRDGTGFLFQERGKNVL